MRIAKRFFHYIFGWYVEIMVKGIEKELGTPGSAKNPFWGNYIFGGPYSYKPKSYHLGHLMAILHGYLFIYLGTLACLNDLSRDWRLSITGIFLVLCWLTVGIITMRGLIKEK